MIVDKPQVIFGTDSELSLNQRNSFLILVADNDGIIQEMLCRAMETEGYQVIAASNGKQCLEVCDRLHPDIVLLDALMPEIDGFTCCRQLRSLAERDRSPILMITGLNDSKLIEQAFASGATDYITKPIHLPLLRQRVRSLIQQSTLYQQVQRLNADLELQVQERTLQLQQALKFEATLKRITDKVRDSLDENQILQTAVQELAATLEVGCCNAALYDSEQNTSNVRYEYTTSIAGYQDRGIQMDNRPEIYQMLKDGLHFQFCATTPNPIRGRVAMFACPMIDNRRTVGDLWLINPGDWTLNELEIRLVQQVANQCAIAVRQARLYQTAQAHVAELEKLNQLKDDFLSTISHELRTPMTTIKVALQMLDAILHRKGRLREKHSIIAKYLPILQTECNQEIKLINDLLTLQQLEAGEQPLTVAAIEMHIWLPQLLKPFQERTQNLKQSLNINLPEYLPLLITNTFSIERILTELLTNACKYTPSGEQITVAVKVISNTMQISVTNSGVTIPANELSRIFDKFYRIPGTDRWRNGGTGLGLALVKRLVGYLDASIEVESAAEQTCFTLQLPLKK